MRYGIWSKLNRSPEGGDGGGTPDTATIESLTADVAALTTNNQKLLGESKAIRTLNTSILDAFGVDSKGSAEDKLAAVQLKLSGQTTAATSKDDEMTQLQSQFKTLQTSLAGMEQKAKDATQAEDKLTAEGEIRKQLVESKVVASAHDMILAMVSGKSDKSETGFGVTTAKGRLSLADYTKEVVSSIPQIVEANGRPGAAPSGGNAQPNTGPDTYDSLISQGRFGDAMALKNAQ